MIVHFALPYVIFTYVCVSVCVHLSCSSPKLLAEWAMGLECRCYWKAVIARVLN